MFLAKLTPEALTLIRELFVYFSGDWRKAREALVRVRDHGLAYGAKKTEVDARLDAIDDDDDKGPAS